MSNRHTELEYKFNADHVPTQLFVSLMENSLPDDRRANLTFDDVYWKRGAMCVRHRLRNAGELTVKERRSQDSLRERLEINLHFDGGSTNQEDVEAFLAATGYERLFTLRKLMCHVFIFTFHSGEVEASIYEVGRVDNWGISGVRRFIEVEVQGNGWTDDECAEVLDYWKEWLQRRLGCAEPLNESLLEIYTATSPSTNYRI